jgi:hypothetical protein
MDFILRNDRRKPIRVWKQENPDTLLVELQDNDKRYFDFYFVKEKEWMYDLCKIEPPTFDSLMFPTQEKINTELPDWEEFVSTKTAGKICKCNLINVWNTGTHEVDCPDYTTKNYIERSKW